MVFVVVVVLCCCMWQTRLTVLVPVAKYVLGYCTNLTVESKLCTAISSVLYLTVPNCTGTATDIFRSLKVLIAFSLEVFTGFSLDLHCIFTALSLHYHCIDHISLEASLEVGANLSLEVTSPYHHEPYVSTYM
jgi:hypothetical protein